MGSVSMIVPALLRTSTNAVVYRKAIVAVRLARTLALTPLPRPSERMEMIRPSGLMRRERKTSPETTWRALARWQKSTSIKLSPIVLMLGIVQFRRRKGLRSEERGGRE